MRIRPTIITLLLVNLLTGCASSTFMTSSSRKSTEPMMPQGTSVESGVQATTNVPGPSIERIQVDDNALMRTVDLTAHPDDVWERIRMGFAIPNLDTPLVVQQQAWYLSHQEFLQRSVGRSSLYLYHVVEELRKRGMPTELALLPFIESAYDPMAYSRAHASGMWQFIPSTGRNFKLRQDWWRDERRDVIASTDAALNYLQMLYEMYGDWPIALAAYNWGEGAVGRAISRNQAAGKSTDYASITMPDETRNYFPKLQALKNIIANPAAFDIVLPRISNEPYFISVTATRDIDIQTAARMANMGVDEFKALNPSFNRPIITAAAEAQLLLPADRAANFQEQLENSPQPLVNWQAYTVHRKDQVDKIAARFGMTATSLCEANGLAPHTRFKGGEVLLVRVTHGKTPGRSHELEQNEMQSGVDLMRAAYRVPPPAAKSAKAGAQVYIVHKGDTLFSIAKRTGTSVETIKHLNPRAVNGIAKGQKLIVRPTSPDTNDIKAARLPEVAIQ